MKSRILSLILVLCMLLASVPSAAAYTNIAAEEKSEPSTRESDTDIAYHVEGGNIYFDKESGEITGCDESVTVANIPAEIGGVAVTSIGIWAFYGCTNLTSVTIPDSVTSIGWRAFWGCESLTGIWVDENNEYYSSDEYGVLFNKGKTTLIQAPGAISEYAISNSVTSIGASAFRGCTNLTSVTIPNSVTSIGSDAFWGCTSLTNVTIPDSVTFIGDYAFYGCTSLTNIVIGNGVRSLSSDAFRNTAVYKDLKYWTDSVLYISNWLIEADTSISGEYSILAGTVGIADSAFQVCRSLTSVTIPDSVTSIGDTTFDGCTSLTSVTIPDSVTSIGWRAFCDCANLTTVTIPDSVTSIDSNAFANCTSLTSVTIGNGVTSIDSAVFANCTSLTNIVIGNGVRSIDSNAFSNTAVYNDLEYWTGSVLYISNWLIKADASISGEYSIPAGTVGIADSAFEDCTSLTSVTIPDSVTSIGDSAFRSSSNLTGVTIGNGVTSIGWSAFRRCTSLTSVTIPDSVTSIGDYTFYDCESLTSVTIPGSVTSIGDYTFYDCESLTSVTILGSVTSIGDYTFYDCESLTSVTIPGSVTSIGERAFEYCTSLTSVTISDSVTSIGDAAFNGCESLTGIWVDENNEYYSSDEYGVLFNNGKATLIQAPGAINGKYVISNSVTSIGAGAFSGCTSLTNVTIPDSVTSIGSDAFYRCASLTSVTIPGSVTTIDSYTFSHCESLTTVTIPDSVTSIGKGAFRYCTCLTSVTIPDSVTSIGGYTFYCCESLTTVTIPGSVTDIDLCTFCGCTSLTSVTIPESATSIGKDAFSSCSSLTSVTIPDSVTSIDSYAFYDCESLMYVAFLGDAPELSYKVFQIWDSGYNINIPGLTLYYIEGKDGWTTPTWGDDEYPTATWDGEHIYAETITEPTCTKDGYTTNTCVLCSESYVDSYVDATGHDYESSVTAPTCTKQGYTTYTCTVCGDSFSDYVVALGHDYVDGVCTRCGADDPSYEPFDPTEEFTDIPSNAWYLDSVAFAVKNGLMNGMGNGEFRPDEPTTRAMVVTILYRLSGSSSKYENNFSDVLNNNWYTDAISWAAYYGIVNGMTATTFEPETSMTREMLAVILYRYTTKKTDADTSKKADLSVFPDESNVSPWAKEAMQWAVANGIVNGVGDGKTTYLQPLGNATRAQVAAIFQRYIKNVLNK